MADAANMGLIKLNDMVLVQNNQLVAYFCDETNMAEIFQCEEDDILDKLEKRDDNILLVIRRSLLHKIASLYKDFHVTKAKKRHKGSKLVLKDIYVLGYCILNDTTYNLSSVYTPTRQTRRNAPADAPAPGHATASLPASNLVPASETVAAIGPLLAAARELTSAPSLASAPTATSVSEHAPAAAPAPAPSTSTSTSPAPELIPTSEIAHAPAQGPVPNMQQTIVPPQIQHQFDKMKLEIEKMKHQQTVEIVKMNHQQTLLKDVNSQQKIHITILENKISHLANRVNILESLQPQVGDTTQAQHLPNRLTPGATAATTASVPALASASAAASASEPASAPAPASASALVSAAVSSPVSDSSPVSAPASTPSSTVTSASTITSSSAPAQAVATGAAITPGAGPPTPDAPIARQDLSSQLPMKRGPQNEHIFIDKVDAFYTKERIIEYVNERTNIEKGAITVLELYERDGNKAFKVTVPTGKQQQTIACFGNEVTAEPYRFFKKNGNHANQNNFRGSSNFRGSANFRGSSNYRGSGNYSGRPNNQYGGRSNRPSSYNQQLDYQQQSYQQQRPRGNYYR